MAPIFQITTLNAFSVVKMYEFWSKFHCINNVPVNGLVPTRQQAIIGANDGQITDAYMHHSASMSFNLL